MITRCSFNLLHGPFHYKRRKSLFKSQKVHCCAVLFERGIMAHVEILVGSKSDLPELTKSNLIGRLESAGVSYAVSVCSAHRNSEELKERILKTYDYTGVYVCAAGMAAALPGVVKGLLLRLSLATVFGVALPSKDYPEAYDAKISIERMPPGVKVELAGVGTEGFDQIADEVIRLAQEYNPEANQEKLDEVIEQIKPPHFDIDLEEV